MPGMNAILVDDEELALQYLERQLQKISDLTIMATFTYFDIETHYETLKNVDVVFLDIEMPQVNGLELAEKIVEINPGISIVFVTAYNEYAVQAFELNALDYVVKPVQLERLQQTTDRLKTRYSEHDTSVQTQNSALRINIFGEITVSLSHQYTYSLKWRTAKAEEMFLFLLLHSGETVQKSVLIDTLWPDFPLDKAYSHLYTAVYHVRKTLARFRDHIGIHNKNGGYVLLMENTIVDAWEWEKRIQSLQAVNPDTIDHYEEIMTMLKGTFPGGRDYLWAEGERYRLQQIWLKYAYQMAEYYEANDNPETAQSWYIRITDVAPEEEKAAFALMKIYAQFNYRLLVTYQFNTLKQAMDKIDVPIKPEITDWYDSWKKT